MLDLRRREFITLLGGAAASWPVAARAQQSMPLIGFLSARGPGDVPRLMAAFHTGLKATGFVEGQNVAIEYRFAESRNERLPALAADLVQRQVTVIAAVTTPAALRPRRRPRPPLSCLKPAPIPSSSAWSPV